MCRYHVQFRAAITYVPACVPSGLPSSTHVNVALPGARFELLVKSAQLLRIHLRYALLLPFLPCLIFHDLQNARTQSGAQHHVTCNRAMLLAATEELGLVEPL